MANQPKKYKKFVATAATATLVASAIVPVASANELVFPDMAGYDANTIALVEDLAAAGIIVGSNGKFNPQGDVSRKHAVLILGRYLESLGLEASEGVKQFDDVDGSDQEFARLALLVRDLGVFNGNDLEQLNPYGKFTRQNMALVMDRVFQVTTGKTLKEIADEQGKTANVADINKVKDEAKEAVLGANALGLSKVATFNPEGTAKRVHFAQFFYIAAPILEEHLDLAVSVDTEIKAVEAAVKALPAANTVTAANAAAAQTAVNTLNTAIKALEDAVKAAGEDLLADDAAAATKAIADGKAAAKAVQDAINATVKAEVVSVSAINGKTIQINFTAALDTASAETEANYSVAPGLNVTDAKLSADKKTVTLTLDATMSNGTAYTVTVDKDLQVANGSAFAEKDFITNFLFNDEVAPTVSAVSTPNGNLRIALNEALSAPSDANPIAVVVNGQSITINTTNNNTGWVSDNVITIPKASLPALTSGQSYSLAVAGARDLLGNAMTLYSGNFNYQNVTDTTAPTLVSTKVTGETSVELTFSEELTAANAADLGLVVKKNGQTLSGAVATTTDNVTYEVDLSAVAGVYGNNETSSTLELTVVGFKDQGNNIGASVTRTVNLAKDTVKPTITRAVYSSTNNNVTLQLSEEVTVAGNLASDITIINNTTSQVVSPSAPAQLSGDGKSIVIPTAGFANGDYTVRVNAGTVADTALTPNQNAALSTTFTVSNELTATTVSGVSANRDVLTVNYSAAVKGGQGATSAANAANYKLDGAALPAGTLITLNAASDTATITLPAGSIATTHTGILTVSNVEAANGAKLATSNHLVALVDTKAPVLQSARVVNGELVLTISENVAGFTNLDFTDFVVQVNGVDVTEAAGTLASTQVGPNEFNISVSDASLATGNVTVKVSDTADAADAATNRIVTGTSVTATR